MFNFDGIYDYDIKTIIFSFLSSFHFSSSAETFRGFEIIAIRLCVYDKIKVIPKV